ncbi:MAG: hypothetical protein RSB38_02605 [Oscillospiraceae bacterium]
MKKFLALCLSVTCAVTMLTGCGMGGSGKPTSSSDDGKTEISVGNWPKENDQALRDVFEKRIEKLKELDPNINLVKDEWVYDLDSFLPKAASGQLPTIYNTFFTEMTKIMDAGYAADVTEQLKKNGYDGVVNEQIMNLVTRDGKQYGVPETAYMMGLACNVKMFEEAGLLDENGVPKFPQTYQELAETAKIIHDKTGKAGFFMATKSNQGGWHFMNIAWSFGVEFMKKTDNKWNATFNTPEMVEAVQYVKDLKWKYNVLTENALVDTNEFDKLFATDQVAMGITAPNNFKTPISTYGMKKDNIAVSILPAGPKQRASLMGGVFQVFAPNSTKEQIDAGFKWFDISGISPKVTDEMKKEWAEAARTDNENGYVVGCPELPIWTNNERINAEKEATKQYENVNPKMFEAFDKADKVVLKPEEPVCAQDLYKILDSIIQEVLINQNSDPKALVEKANNDFQVNFLDKVK